MLFKEKEEERLRWCFLTTDHENADENQELAKKLCEDDLLFFVNNFVYTYDPRGAAEINRHLPFLLYGYQEDGITSLREHIEQGKDQLWEKSRDMGATWCISAVALWGWKFHGWDVLVGSRKEDLVDKRGDINSCIEKIRYMEHRLPVWLQSGLREGDTDKSMLLRNALKGNIIAGESNNAYFGTGGRYKFILFDEYPKWEQTDETAWRSSGDSTPCRIVNGTPGERGKNCYAYKLIEQGVDKMSFHWILHPKKNIGLYYERSNEKVYFDVNKQDELDKALELRSAGIRVGSDWYDSECERRSDLEIAQELDISWDASLAGLIFNYNDKQIGEFEYNPNLPLYTAWDFGMDTTALLWIQTDGRKDYIIDEYENKGEDIYHYIEVVNSKPYKTASHFGDPYSGGVKQMQSATTVAQILMRQGIRMRLANRVSIADRINASRIRLKTTWISKKCPLFIDTLFNWRFRKPNRNDDKPLPEHSKFSHLGEAHGYFSVGMTMGLTQIVKSRYASRK